MTITTGDVVAKVKELAEREPNRVLPRWYVQRDDNGLVGPGCIIGTALHELGASLDDLAACESWTVEVVLRRLGIRGSVGAGGWLSEVQRATDSAVEWKRAVAEAVTPRGDWTRLR
jgi:hypothetical protein